MEVPRDLGNRRPHLRKHGEVARPNIGPNLAQHNHPRWIRLRSVENPPVLVPLHLPSRSNNGGHPEKQPARNAPGPSKMFRLQGVRDSLPDADSNLGPRLEEVQRLRVHTMYGVY